jgi:hypothetical protein
MLSLSKSAVLQQSATLFQQHWGHLKGNYDLNSAFEKADRLLEQKRTGSHFYYNTGRQLTILSQQQFAVTERIRRKTFYLCS